MKKKLLALVMTVAMAQYIDLDAGDTQDAQTSVLKKAKTTETVAQETPVLEGKLTV